MVTIFKKLKPGKKIHDTLYGNGTVTKVTQRSAYIKLVNDHRITRYDIQHVNHFIRLGFRK